MEGSPFGFYEKVHVSLRENSYDIHIGPGIMTEIPSFLIKGEEASSYFIVTDSQVEDLLGIDLQNILEENEIHSHLLSFPSGEASKNMDTVTALACEMVNMGADRKSVILALGGGVVGDVAGFLASIYMRGIPFYQIPTTLLAQVDSSVGGKTGVDLPQGKNLLGTFYQPRGVFADTVVLATLPGHEIRNGLSEVVKYGMIRSYELFQILEDKNQEILNLVPEVMSYIVAKSCSIKAEIVSKDEKESGLRRILNFGHTIGHAVEAAAGYSIPHGEAVSIGMIAASRISLKRGLLKEEDFIRLHNLLNILELPTAIPRQYETGKLIEFLRHDKKASHGKVHFILPKGLGDVIITPDVSMKDLTEAIDESMG